MRRSRSETARRGSTGRRTRIAHRQPSRRRSHPAPTPRIARSIRRELSGPGGGIYRYRGDTYYGGGQWLLLTSSLAWHDAVSGHGNGIDLQAWVRAQAHPNGDLPEQVTEAPQDTTMIDPWVRRWGPIATPLLWSHAMYVIAEAAAL